MTMSSVSWKQLTIAAAFLPVVAGIGYCVHQENKADEQAAAALEAAKAVDTLPAGTEVAWIGYIDRRKAAAIQRDGNVLRVTEMIDYALSGVTYVSRNMPYEVSCSILGVTVTFGYGEGATTVWVQGLVLDPNVEKPPPLNVHEASVAAKALRERICEHVAKRLDEILN